jgi:hypothetical protein
MSFNSHNKLKKAISDSIELKDIMCGDEAAAVRATLDIKYPVSSNLLVLHPRVLY